MKNEKFKYHILKIKLNDMNYRYDVYQMINLFCDFREIEFVDNEEDYRIDLSKESIIICHENVLWEYKISHKYTFKEELKKGVFTYFSENTFKSLPWGTLIGIRPSKKAMTMIREGKEDDEIINEFKVRSLTSEEKTKLCIEVAKREMKFINRDYKTLSIYIGMPFCPTRCLYCSFASNPIGGKYKSKVGSYLKALSHEINEISQYIDSRNLSIECVYFGGGTPTAVNDDEFKMIMEEIYNCLVKDRNAAEFTVECGRPDSISYDKLKTMKDLQVSRISINPQTMNDESLKLIGRNHSVEDVIEVFKMARELKFNNINMDMIVGLPGEKLEHVKRTCEHIKKLKPESFTVHGMSVKRASRLHENILNNINYEIESQDELNKMYNTTIELSKALNMEPYYMYRQKNMVGNMENIGYSRLGAECIYNIEMMEDRQTIVALGADAVSKIVYREDNRIERLANLKDIDEYVNRIDESIEKKKKLLDTLYE
ncbi:MAG: coproporphyrinogen III oxidase [Clostridium sp.]